MSRRRRPARRLAAVGAVGAVALLAGCGEPTAQLVQAGTTDISFELPRDFADLSGDEGGRAVYGRPGSSSVDFSADPVLFMITSDQGATISFKDLRTIATGGRFDPLDPKLEPLPDQTVVIEYEEITEPDVWGIRLRMVVGQGAKDFQALVDRASDQVVVTELACTQACFVEQVDLIDQIQGSWSLEP